MAMPAKDDAVVLDLLLGKNNAILKTSYSAVMGGDDIIISGVAWKRRSGFGKYDHLNPVSTYCYCG
jgi:hypothetical protein